MPLDQHLAAQKGVYLLMQHLDREDVYVCVISAVSLWVLFVVLVLG